MTDLSEAKRLAELGRPKVVENLSGVEPLGSAVLVQLYEVKQRGVIELPYEVRERDQMGEQRAVIVEFGEDAAENAIAKRLQIGDSIVFAKYAGFLVPGLDKSFYRVLNIKDIFLRVKREDEGKENA